MCDTLPTNAKWKMDKLELIRQKAVSFKIEDDPESKDDEGAEGTTKYPMAVYDHVNSKTAMASYKEPDLEWVCGENTAAIMDMMQSKLKTEFGSSPYVKKAAINSWDDYRYEDCVVTMPVTTIVKTQWRIFKIWSEPFSFPVRIPDRGPANIRPAKIVITSKYHPGEIWKHTDNGGDCDDKFIGMISKIFKKITVCKEDTDVRNVCVGNFWTRVRAGVEDDTVEFVDESGSEEPEDDSDEDASDCETLSDYSIGSAAIEEEPDESDEAFIAPEDSDSDDEPGDIAFVSVPEAAGII